MEEWEWSVFSASPNVIEHVASLTEMLGWT